MSPRRTVALGLVLAVAAVAFFWRLGALPFYSKGEPREAVQIVEAVQHHSWILQLRNGVHLPSKPPLFHWLGWNMQYHTAHHLFPSVPFHRLPALHRAIVAKTGQEPPTMGYFVFQKAVWAKLLRGRERSDYTDGSVWIE